MRGIPHRGISTMGICYTGNPAGTVTLFRQNNLEMLCLVTLCSILRIKFLTKNVTGCVSDVNYQFEISGVIKSATKVI